MSAAAAPVFAQAPVAAAIGPTWSATAADAADPCQADEVPPPPPERPSVDGDGNPVDAQGEPIPPPPPERPAELDAEGNEVDVEGDPVDAEADPEAPDCLRGYRMRGGAAELVIDAVVCDISRPFTVTGSNVSIDFTPNSTDPSKGGKYSYFDDFGDFQVAGKGTYSLKLKGKGGVIVAKGPGKAITPRGTFTWSGTERYKLSPATCP
jgi:hypothetical protein